MIIPVNLADEDIEAFLAQQIQNKEKVEDKVKEQTNLQPVEQKQPTQNNTITTASATQIKDTVLFYWGFWFMVDMPIVRRNGVNIIFHSVIDKDSIEELKQMLSSSMADIVNNYLNVGITDMSKMYVYLFIDSPGGSIPDGFDLIDFISNYPLPIVTIGTGTVASMAVPLLLAGKKRYFTPNAHILVHQFRANIGGKRQDILDMLQHLEKVHKQLVTYISSHSKLNQSQVQDMMKNETWLTVQEALEYGLADGIWKE